MGSENTIFWIKDGAVEQQGQVVLDKIDIHLDKGEFVYLIGKTGMGEEQFAQNALWRP